MAKFRKAPHKTLAGNIVVFRKICVAERKTDEILQFIKRSSSKILKFIKFVKLKNQDGVSRSRPQDQCGAFVA